MKKRFSRRSIRLKGYDYSRSGLYFVTICCKNMVHYFGTIRNQQMYLNDAGKMVTHEWKQLPHRFSNIELHEYIVMPNHFHAIIEIVGATLVVAHDTNKQTPHDTNKQTPHDTNKQTPHDTNKQTPHDTNKQTPHDTNKQTPHDTNKQTPHDTNKQTPHDTNKQTHNDGTTPHGQPQGIAPTRKTLGDMVGAFQSITTVEYIRGVKQNDWKRFDKKLWQRNYWEHIIRNETSLHRIANYIINNPTKWEDDKFNKL